MTSILAPPMICLEKPINMKTKLKPALKGVVRAYLDLKPPDYEFSTAYAQLWKNSKAAAFQAPSFLKYLNEWWPNNTATFRYYQDGELVGAVYFLYQNGMLNFLSNEKSDYNCFVFHQACSEETKKHFFVNLLEECARKNCSLRLHCFPEGAQYRLLVQALEQQNKLRWVDAAFSACPLIVANSPDELFERITSSRSLRRDVRRMKNNENVDLEFLQDDTDLDQWINDFCRLHIKRWKNTDTPSRLSDTKEQLFLKGCVKSWIDDSILMRSAIKIDGERVSLNFGLLEAGIFIGRGQAYDITDYGYNSLGRTLILIIGEWMRENNFSCLNMGLGKARYKQDIANQMMSLRCISIAPPIKAGFLLKAYVYKWVWEKAHIRLFYRNKIKPFINRLRAGR